MGKRRTYSGEYLMTSGLTRLTRLKWNTNNSSLTKRVVESLKPIGQDLELFGKFLSMFSESDCLCKATQAYYIKVIELLEYLVMVLQRRMSCRPAPLNTRVALRFDC